MQLVVLWKDMFKYLVFEKLGISWWKAIGSVVQIVWFLSEMLHFGLMTIELTFALDPWGHLAAWKDTSLHAWSYYGTRYVKDPIEFHRAAITRPIILIVHIQLLMMIIKLVMVAQTWLCRCKYLLNRCSYSFSSHVFNWCRLWRQFCKLLILLVISAFVELWFYNIIFIFWIWLAH